MNPRAEPPVRSIGTDPAAFTQFYRTHVEAGGVAGSSAGRRCCATYGAYDWSGGSNVVEVVISVLRRKLGEGARSLQTVRGCGYRFTAPS